MESMKNALSINIPNFSGPLETLLDLAKSQKVDLAKISITKLADQFLEFIKSKDLNLEIASEYLLMATWLAYLKSKLLLPEDDDDEFKASEVAEKLKLQLKKLELIRLLSDQLLKKPRRGKDIFYRGMKGGIRSIKTPIYDISLYELLKTYSSMKMQKAFKTINIPRLPVLTTEEAIKYIEKILPELDEWNEIDDFIPSYYKKNQDLKKTGMAGIFSATLEMAKEGKIDIIQKRLFDKLLIKRSL